MPTSRSWLSCVSLQLRKEMQLACSLGSPNDNWAEEEILVFKKIISLGDVARRGSELWRTVDSDQALGTTCSSSCWRQKALLSNPWLAHSGPGRITMAQSAISQTSDVWTCFRVPFKCPSTSKKKNLWKCSQPTYCIFVLFDFIYGDVFKAYLWKKMSICEQCFCI